MYECVLLFTFAWKNWRLPEYQSDHCVALVSHSIMFELREYVLRTQAKIRYQCRTNRLIIYFKYGMHFMNEHQSEIVFQPSNFQI